MNIIEAVKSNKPFRRPGWLHFIQFNQSRGRYEWASNGESIVDDLRPEWFTYEDWEIEEEVSITSNLFDSKAKAVLSRWQYNTLDNTSNIVELALADLKRELGL